MISPASACARSLSDRQPQRLTETDGQPMDPRPTPDGESVVFASGTTQPLNRDLHKVSMDGRDQVQLTDRPLNLSWQPAVSPDGTKIAYVVEKRGNSDIHVMDIDGQGNANITNTNKGYWAPTWAPDSKSFVVTTRDSERGNLELVEISADGSRKNQITEIGLMTDTPVFAPDGEHIVFGVDPAFGSPVLSSVKRDGSELRTYATDLILAGTPSVSPQGIIAFSAIDRHYKMTVYTVELGSDEPARKVVDADFAISPTFSPDGSRLAWVMPDKNRDWQIFEARADGSEVRAVTSEPALHTDPCYTPDGEALLYLSNQDGKTEVYRKQLR